MPIRFEKHQAHFPAAAAFDPSVDRKPDHITIMKVLLDCGSR